VDSLWTTVCSCAFCTLVTDSSHIVRILGISNPNFLGVTVATKAVCTDWFPAAHMLKPYEWQQLATMIFHYGPDVLVVGGWSDGYTQLLTELRRNGNKNFPIINVSHSSLFHGSYFHKDWQSPEYETAFKTGLVDLMGFVHPQTAEYYQKVRETFAVWVPHAFKPRRNPAVERQTPFKIGVLGSPQWFKNVEGPLIVARDFAARHKNVEVMTAPPAHIPQEAFLATVSTCSVLIHMSHLECYSNTVQEAWSRGVPVITSPSSYGLIDRNPLLTPIEKRTLKTLQVDGEIEPVQLYQRLNEVYAYWDSHSRDVHAVYTNLASRTAVYLHEVFSRLIKDFPNREHDVEFFEAPFTKEGILWKELSTP
jgi:hypothetical protein